MLGSCTCLFEEHLMIKTIAKYIVVGGFNTLIHWITFAIIYYAFGHNQMISNFAGFCVAVTFSFFVNAKWTFESEHTKKRFLLYVGFMGTLALSCGYFAERIDLNPIFTLIIFSIISLFIGFIYSKLVVFKGEK